MTASLLDKLVETEDRRSPVAQLRASLCRDLEAMLNSRRRLLSWPSELEELDRSLLNYGLDDLVNETLTADEFRTRFIEDVERLLRRLEPRIGRFEVNLLPNKDELDRTLRIRISGVVTLDGERQELMFDSHLDPIRSYLVMHS
ncbi:type VI secretion system baseplate subunit TssE [Sphingomonas sp. ASY06-1R]|jgi:type VI secretion system protein ImpF|uniref:type VI secretion system baseplate subunit TssE n=1 Tax=Sphingomonas sp. ASY06-1R TaxID=3445771 RepID=UPI003FA32AE9